MILLDQGIKLYIHNRHMDKSFNILFDFVRFEPKINTKYSWINSLFDLGIGKAVHVIFAVLVLISLLLVYCFIAKIYKVTKLIEFSFISIISGCICSLIDKLFWNGSLDYIQFKNLFTFDLKDVYISIFEVIVIAMLIFNYKNIRRLDDKKIRYEFRQYIGSFFK